MGSCLTTLEGNSSTVVVTNRATLWGGLAAATSGDAAKIVACLCSYSPPAERLIIRRAADFAALGVSKEAVHAAGDESFWAYKDFESVFASFALAETDAERRVMGIEGVRSPEQLRAIVESGARSLRIGHLSLPMCVGKVRNGEWRWIDEARCVMHTATPKPALLRQKVRALLHVELSVRRHEAFASDAESVGDLVIFDMDQADVHKPTGNTKVFCQDPASYSLAPYESLAPEMHAAVRQMLEKELGYSA